MLDEKTLEWSVVLTAEVVFAVTSRNSDEASAAALKQLDQSLERTDNVSHYITTIKAVRGQEVS